MTQDELFDDIGSDITFCEEKDTSFEVNETLGHVKDTLAGDNSKDISDITEGQVILDREIAENITDGSFHSYHALESEVFAADTVPEASSKEAVIQEVLLKNVAPETLAVAAEQKSNNSLQEEVYDLERKEANLPYDQVDGSSCRSQDVTICHSPLQDKELQENAGPCFEKTVRVEGNEDNLLDSTPDVIEESCIEIQETSVIVGTKLSSCKVDEVTTQNKISSEEKMQQMNLPIPVPEIGDSVHSDDLPPTQVGPDVH